MAKCGQACPYNTLDGCKVKEYNAICPLTNMATLVTEYRMTHADRFRSMTDEELAKALYYGFDTEYCSNDPACAAMLDEPDGIPEEKCIGCLLNWLRQPAGEGL